MDGSSGRQEMAKRKPLIGGERGWRGNRRIEGSERKEGGGREEAARGREGVAGEPKSLRFEVAEDDRRFRKEGKR
ncbi:hypothetical protein COCNU_03G003190 [Cocos nucifera]|uniref:Uncharacterized protein n=1 Tax=Cocos nucifera TaxID=13894 RepID=A0A8K0I1M9_COCNU|nr:hypothetical protein COCNU_03G003190 [Cocos nucifera]